MNFSSLDLNKIESIRYVVIPHIIPAAKHRNELFICKVIIYTSIAIIILFSMIGIICLNSVLYVMFVTFFTKNIMMIKSRILYSTCPRHIIFTPNGSVANNIVNEAAFLITSALKKRSDLPLTFSIIPLISLKGRKRFAKQSIAKYGAAFSHCDDRITVINCSDRTLSMIMIGAMMYVARHKYFIKYSFNF